MVSPDAARLGFAPQQHHAVADPGDVLGNLCVDAVFAFTSAPLAPAHDARDEEGVTVLRNVRPAAVALTRVLFDLVVAGTEHPVGDAELAGLDADGPVDVRHGETLQDRGGLPSLAKTPETTDQPVRLPHQDLRGDEDVKYSTPRVERQFREFNHFMVKTAERTTFSAKLRSGRQAGRM